MARRKKATTTAPSKDPLGDLSRRLEPQKQPPAIGRLASSLEKKEMDWLVSPWVAKGVLTIVAGAPNTGKSTFGAWLMSHACATVVLPGAEEDVETMMVGRLEKHGVDLASVLILDGVEYTFPAHKQRVAEIVQSHRAELLWIDPLDNYIGEAGENDGQAVRTYLESLAWIAKKCNCAVVGVRHPGKTAGNLLPGSRQWRAVPRTVLELLVDEGPPLRRLCNSNKDSPGKTEGARYYDLVGERGEPRRFVWGDYVPTGTIDEIRNVTDKIERWKIDQAECLLRQLLAENEQEGTWVYKMAEAERINDRCVRRAADRLGVVIRREGSGKDHKSYWSLPKVTPDTPDIV